MLRSRPEQIQIDTLYAFQEENAVYLVCRQAHAAAVAVASLGSHLVKEPLPCLVTAPHGELDKDVTQEQLRF